MKRFVLILICSWLTLAVYGQTSFYNFESTHYRVNSDLSQAHAVTVANKMEAALKLFNDLCHFDPTQLNTKLKVTVFNKKAGFDEYLTRILEKTRENFVYIHYSDLRKSEMVGFNKESEEEFNASLLHQGFIQFLKAFIPNPPIWMREGIATSFEASVYDPVKQSFTYRPNYAWLDTLKAILNGTLPGRPVITSAALLTGDRETVGQQIEAFYPQAWGLLMFLQNSEKREYNRILWDSFSALDPEKSLKDNSISVMKYAFGWYDEPRMMKDYTSYIFSIKTFNDLVTEGINLYTIEDMDKANQSFMRALTLEPQNYIPYYYLGLIAYAKNEYIQAEGYYKAALALGADSALTKYALGVNAFADNRFDVATNYLKEAKTGDPSKYTEKVDSLLQRIESLR